MEQVEMKGYAREGSGKGPSGRMRKEGFVPAVLYGPGVKENIKLKFSAKEVEKVLGTHAGTNVLVNLLVEGEKPMTVLFKNISRHPLSDALFHIDLINILKDRKIAVEVPVVLVGKAVGIERGGILHQEARRLRIECLPHAIPDSVEIDVTHLDIGHSMHVGDIVAKEGVKILDDAKHTVVLVSAPMAEEVVKTAEQIEAELKESFAEKEKPEEEGSKEKEKEKEKEKK